MAAAQGFLGAGGGGKAVDCDDPSMGSAASASSCGMALMSGRLLKPSGVRPCWSPMDPVMVDISDVAVAFGMLAGRPVIKCNTVNIVIVRLGGGSGWYRGSIQIS